MKSRFLAFTQKMPLPKAHSHGRRHFTSLRAARGFALLQTILGLLCMVFTQQLHALFPFILGFLMVMSGSCDIYRGLVTGEFRQAETRLTSQGITTAILGCVILYHYRNADSIIGAIWGIIGLTKGTETLNRMICQLTTGQPFVKELIHGGIELLLGILLLLDPLTAVAHHLFLLGIELVAVGLQAVQETKRVVAGEGA